MKLGESQLNRRDFIDGLIGAGMLAGGGVAADVLLGYLGPTRVAEPDQIVVSGEPLAKLARDRFVLVDYGPAPVLILQLADGGLRAFSGICTHNRCNLAYRPAENDIFCGCHRGRYTVEGVNVPGTPPPRPLRPFNVRRQPDGTLLVSRLPVGAAKPRTEQPATRPAKG